MGKIVSVFLIVGIMTVAIYLLDNQPAFAFLDATFGIGETGDDAPSIELYCFNEEDDDNDGLIDFDDTDC